MTLTPPHLQPLIMLLGQAERERDELAAACREAVQGRDTAQAQSAQLLDYRREYEQRWSTQFRTEGRMELVHCYRGFVERLTQAVEQQQALAAQAGQRVEQALLRLREAETRVAAVRKMIERRVDEARLAGERLEQKASDEFAARAAWGRHDGLAARDHDGLLAHVD